MSQNTQTGAGKMVQTLRAFVTLAKDTSSVPRTHMVTELSVTLVPGDLMLSSDLHQHQACMWYTYIQQAKYSDTKIKSISSLNFLISEIMLSQLISCELGNLVISITTEEVVYIIKYC